MDDVTTQQNHEPEDIPAQQAGQAPAAAAGPALGDAHAALAQPTHPVASLGETPVGQTQLDQDETGAPTRTDAPAAAPSYAYPAASAARSSGWATQSQPAVPAAPTQTLPAYTGQDASQGSSGQGHSAQGYAGQGYAGQGTGPAYASAGYGAAPAGQPYTGQPYAGLSYTGQAYAGGSTAGDGTPPGAGTPYGAYASTPPPARRSRRRRTGLAALAVAGCLAAGTAGGALGVELAGDDSTVATRSPGSTSATQASLVDGTVQAAAATIIPSTVVISVSNNQGEGTGSGVVLDTDGNILTNAHVVNGLNNASIEVTFSDGRTAPADVVGVDASSDLAVIHVTGVDDLTPAQFADSDALVIGQTVVAVGAPLGLSGTVTEGIVSAVDRPVRTGESADASTVLDAVQTDASINPGNSGGPLVNLAGEVVGINSAIATVGTTSGEAGSIGVGFAIPSNDATNTADQLLADGTAEHASLGISASEPQSGTGALVRQVESGSAAAEAGLEQGDLITKLDDRAVVDLDSLLAAVRDHEPGDEVTVTVERDGSEQKLTVTLGSREG